MQRLDLSLWRVSEHLEASFIRAELLRSSSGAYHLVGDFISTEIERDLGDSGTWVVLTITRLSIGIFLRVIGHFWQQGRVIEGFSLLLERGILQLESLAFRSACIDLHFLSAFGGVFCISDSIL